MRWIVVAASVLGALAVASGAFGAHALEGVLDERARGWYDTAVTYHAGHALALLGCGSISLHPRALADAPRRALGLAALAFLAGIALFSGSLYAMAFTGATALGAITPLGGLALIGGWAFLAVAAARLPPALS